MKIILGAIIILFWIVIYVISVTRSITEENDDFKSGPIKVNFHQSKEDFEKEVAANRSTKVASLSYSSKRMKQYKNN